MYFTFQGSQFLLVIYMAPFFELNEVCINFKTLIYIKDLCFVSVIPITSVSMISSCIHYNFRSFLILDVSAVYFLYFQQGRGIRRFYL